MSFDKNGLPVSDDSAPSVKNTTNKYLSTRHFDPTDANYQHGFGDGMVGDDTLNPDYVDPSTQNWGDSSVESIGNYSLGANRGTGGLLNRPDVGITSYSLSDLGGYHAGANQYGVDSLEHGKGLVEKYGGKLVKGYQGGEDQNYSDAGGGPGVASQGWGYFWVPPGTTLAEQRKATNQLGLTHDPHGLDALNDDQMGLMMLAMFGGAAAAGGAFGGAGAAEAGAGATVPADYAGEAAYLGGTGEAGINGGLVPSASAGGGAVEGGVSGTIGNGSTGGGVDVLTSQTVGNGTGGLTLSNLSNAAKVVNAAASLTGKGSSSSSSQSGTPYTPQFVDYKLNRGNAGPLTLVPTDVSNPSYRTWNNFVAGD